MKTVTIGIALLYGIGAHAQSLYGGKFEMQRNPSSRYYGAAATLFVIVALSGCAQVGMFTAQDAATAAAVNPANAACYQEFGALGQAQAAATGPGGILTVVATKEQLQAIMSSPACLPLTAAILAEIVKLGVPAAGLVIP